MYDRVLKASLEEQRIIIILYLKGNEITQRTIKVLKITDDDVQAYCFLRKQIRRFKKNNILAADYTH
ncbi:hypothetical protein CLHOM_17630 [Clostridium homopropionicum DSM 5847]|uniref:WYL domain-containing protein n=1 Tax=Clostridium homopropionicum DSM 5847 TaxID=1121318 RepID=A0A0L6Z9N1_9CLOT|nr:hypothetical protein [Clostridium homopropionicum]KOA19674.1 hypothetical protein CLHOM_17630 [Clostridium homopropionicum DSM 5847]SFF80355.1 hypothetical protein SAMN04488501_102231 [Clostridium homopropionicum]